MLVEVVEEGRDHQITIVVEVVVPLCVRKSSTNEADTQCMLATAPKDSIGVV